MNLTLCYRVSESVTYQVTIFDMFSHQARVPLSFVISICKTTPLCIKTPLYNSVVKVFNTFYQTTIILVQNEQLYMKI